MLLAPYPLYRSVSWCLSEGYRNGDQIAACESIWLRKRHHFTLVQLQRLVSVFALD